MPKNDNLREQLASRAQALVPSLSLEDALDFAQSMLYIAERGWNLPVESAHVTELSRWDEFVRAWVTPEKIKIYIWERNFFRGGGNV